METLIERITANPTAVLITAVAIVVLCKWFKATIKVITIVALVGLAILLYSLWVNGFFGGV